jgi:hypothetical protein
MSGDVWIMMREHNASTRDVETMPRRAGFSEKRGSRFPENLVGRKKKGPAERAGPSRRDESAP